MVVPGPLARCLWGVDPRQTARMEIEVFGEDGVDRAGTKAISYDEANDVVKLIATDFTYSRKDIVARPMPVEASPGMRSCDVTQAVCVTIDKARRLARISVSGAPKGATDIIAVALRGADEDRRSQVVGRIKKGKATLTVKLAGAKSSGQVWVVRTPTTFMSSFQVG
jgi:hypothetical protein